MTQYFLAAVGAAYLGLAAWCALAPTQTSKAVGFDLVPGAGQSEFLTVYGGLELALGVIFILPLFRPQDAGYALSVCLILHGCLVTFRAASFALFGGIGATTYSLAVSEWIIFLGSVYFSTRKG